MTNAITPTFDDVFRVDAVVPKELQDRLAAANAALEAITPQVAAIVAEATTARDEANARIEAFISQDEVPFVAQDGLSNLLWDSTGSQETAKLLYKLSDLSANG